MPSLGQRLAALRKEKGLSQAQLAKLLNMGQSTIAMYEKDKRRPDAETLRRLAEFFQISVDYLLGLTDSRERPVYTLTPEAQELFSLLLREPDLQSGLADPLFRNLLKRIPDLTPEERQLLAQHWEWSLRLIERNKEMKEEENRITSKKDYNKKD
ncbi:DNA-binding transcriptional regulator, XRE-family HTH domain [Thermanaeromonas toyohensis ToBE]|uniref:DNA-binding transcriptional regulator, XRE-family HTH domain n=1 Tax=Thermanaeromonas toyohensis ToBE TaxID=698762 RepID=A0A1W1VF72_9FIRM|nr:helix-turn-helix transcriptional regulator [Thermanaeromonas toyohensis]SMB91711.1 DNA-binding transcriptional regulator, XRE-family HTH domain [Thermanaeromonas toyohensis ToBE]